MEPVPGIRHAALLRSPHAHAEILSIDVSKAASHPGIYGVLTGADIAAATGPIPSAVRVPIDYYPMAAGKVRYAGEPVALVAAEDRYVAEDALELIEVEYRPLPPVIDLKAAMNDGSPLLHEAVGSNVAHHRTFRYGDPDKAFEEADRVVRLDWTFPRYSSTPVETYGAVALFEPAPDRYTIWSNFQGPFILHALMCDALRVPGNRLRLITAPQSGGSFGIKQGMFPYLVLLAAASRLLGMPLKWIEDRLEHLVGSSSASNREDAVEAAFRNDGTLTGLRFFNTVDVGAYIRAPEPASVYRMHSASNGAYGVCNISVENRLVTTNRLPIGLNRGYGGPQFFFALERAMEAGARALGIDIAEIRRRNFIPKDAFPYRAAGRIALRRRRLRGRPRQGARPCGLRGVARRARQGAGGGPAVRHWHGGGSRAVRFQHGLCDACPDAGGTRARRRPVRRSRDLHDIDRSVRLGDREDSLDAGRAGTRHGRRPDRGRCARAHAGRHRRGDRGRHPDQRVVPRLRQLREPVLVGGDRRHRRCSAPGCRQGPGNRRGRPRSGG